MLREAYHIFVYPSMLNVWYISEIKNFFRKASFFIAKEQCRGMYS